MVSSAFRETRSSKRITEGGDFNRGKSEVFLRLTQNTTKSKTLSDKLCIIRRKYLAVIEIQWQHKIQFFFSIFNPLKHVYRGRVYFHTLLSRLRPYLVPQNAHLYSEAVCFFFPEKVILRVTIDLLETLT